MTPGGRILVGTGGSNPYWVSGEIFVGTGGSNPTFDYSLFDDIAYKLVIKHAQLLCLGSEYGIYSPELLPVRPISSTVVIAILLCVMDMMSILMDGYFLQRTLRPVLGVYSYPLAVYDITAHSCLGLLVYYHQLKWLFTLINSEEHCFQPLSLLLFFISHIPFRFGS